MTENNLAKKSVEHTVYTVDINNQTDENGKILNETLIQVPGENTNLFYSYSTSLLAT
jgi:hypothetical protein